MIQPVRGIETLHRAFSLAGTRTRKDLPRLLALRAEPVRAQAEVNARVIGAGPSWSLMRKGATRTMVYIAPVERGTRIATRKRPNFAPRLLNLAMEPALQSHRAEVEQGVDELIARIERQFNNG
jgi:hypothetical protein